MKGNLMLVRYLMAGALAALAACGSSESGPDAQVPDLEPRIGSQAFNNVMNEGYTLSADEIAALDTAIEPIANTLFPEEQSGPVTPWSNVPTSGSVDYAGGIEIVPVSDESQRIFGALTVTANFADDGDILGSARDFYTNDDDAITGTLTLTGTFDSTSDLTDAFGIAGELTGELDGPAFSGNADIPIVADFADSATVIYGGGNGTVGGTDVDAAFVVFQN